MQDALLEKAQANSALRFWLNASLSSAYNTWTAFVIHRQEQRSRMERALVLWALQSMVRASN